MDQLIKTNSATNSTFLSTSEVLEEQWKRAKQSIRDKIASTAQSQARRMLEEEIGPEQLCEELSKLRLDYVSINVTENEARDHMYQNYIEATMKNMGHMPIITSCALKLKNDELQMLNKQLTEEIRQREQQLNFQQQQLHQYNNAKNKIRKDSIKLSLYEHYIRENLLPCGLSVLETLNSQYVKKCNEQQLE